MLNEEDSRLKVNISAGQNAGFQMKTHPNIDKALYSSQSVLGLKDPQKPFPAGSPLGILKWRMQVFLYLYTLGSVLSLAVGDAGCAEAAKMFVLAMHLASYSTFPLIRHAFST